MTDPYTRRLETAGKLLYGERWQSPLARAMGVRQSVISMALSGERPPTDDTMKKLAVALGRESKRMSAAVENIDRMRALVEHELRVGRSIP